MQSGYGPNSMGRGPGYKKLDPKKEVPPHFNYARGSEAEQAYMNSLDDKINNINCSCADYIKDNPMVIDRKTGQSSTLAGFQRLRHTMLISAMMYPLSRGLSMDNIISCVGMYAGMSMMDKNFNKSVKSAAWSTVEPYLNKQVETHGPNSKWGKWYDKVQSKLSTGEMPLDPETAAVTQMGLLKKAYSDMRQPGADVDKVCADYDKAVSILHQKAAEDGVSSDDINTHFRFIAGKMIEKDPSNIVYFNETAYDGVTKNAYKECVRTKMDEYGRVYTETGFKWHGEFSNENGTAFTGTFTPRKPRTPSQHAENYENRMDDVINAATESYPKNNAAEAVSDIIHEAQSEAYTRVNRKVRSDQIDSRTADEIRRKISNLEGFDMTEDDLTPDVDAAVYQDISESVTDYAENNGFENECDAHLFDMMKDDGMDAVECVDIKKSATTKCMKKAVKSARQRAVMAGINAVKTEHAQTQQESQEQRHRGSEFGSMFSNLDPNASRGYSR